jgi:thymidine kinase
VQPFHSVCELIPLAESVTKLSAICNHCQDEAAFSKRLTDDKSTIVIGGAEMYVPTCRGCFHAGGAAEVDTADMSTSFLDVSVTEIAADDA